MCITMMCCNDVLVLLRGECFSVTERGMVCITMMCCNDVLVLLRGEWCASL